MPDTNLDSSLLRLKLAREGLAKARLELAAARADVAAALVEVVKEDPKEAAAIFCSEMHEEAEADRETLGLKED